MGYHEGAERSPERGGVETPEREEAGKGERDTEFSKSEGRLETMRQDAKDPAGTATPAGERFSQERAASPSADSHGCADNDTKS